MRVNIYAEEMTNRIEIIEKEIDGIKFEACRFYLYLPASYVVGSPGRVNAGEIIPADIKTQAPLQLQAPFIHREGDDDSSAVTFWSRGKLREILQQAIEKLDEYHANKNK